MLDFLAMPRKRIAKPTTPAPVQPRSIRLDGWQNVLTGLGTSRDKSTYAEVIPTVLTQQQCEDLWKGDDMADLIVTALPGESLREDPTLTIASIEDADERAAAVDTVMAALSDLKVKQAIRRGLEYERAYGGAAIYVGAVDGQDPAEPLQLSSLRAIRHLTVFERRQLTAVSYQENPLLPDYGKPWLYEVQSFSGVGTLIKEN
jgi:phage-related protein (TIGR01555 family)